MTLDADVVRGRAAEIEQALVRLTRIRAAGRDAFLTDADAKDIRPTIGPGWLGRRGRSREMGSPPTSRTYLMSPVFPSADP